MSNEIVMKCSRELTESEQDQVALLVQVQLSILQMSEETAKNEDQKQAYINVVKLIHGCMGAEFGVKIESVGDCENEVQELRPS